MEGEDGPRGGMEGDIRSLYYWSMSAFVMLVMAGALWAVLGVWRLFVGLTWFSRDWLSGTTTATGAIASGIALLCAAGVTLILARWVHSDIVSVFSSRRFQVPREKLLVYSILSLPFGFIIPGLLLILVNIKLSYPEFLPSHAEAYPTAMPGFVQVPKGVLYAGPGIEMEEGQVPAEAPKGLPPVGFDAVPVTEEEAQPAPEFFGEAPEEAEAAPPPEVAPPPGGWEPVPPPPAPPSVAPAEAITGEAPVEEIPEVVGEVVPVAVEGEAVPAVVEAVGEDVPIEAEYEEVPPEDLAEGEAVTGEEEAPKTIEEAHEELLGKLLGK